MAEILGIVASSIQLADAALKIGNNIYKFVDNIGSAPKKVKTFRGDLDQTLSLLKDTRSSLEIAKTKYNNLGDTAKLVENTLKDFNRELAEISITVETLWARSQSWRVKVKIGFKGDSEWVRIDARIRVQYTRLTAASVQLSNKLGLENGERLNDIGSGVTAIGVEITKNVSKPIQTIQKDVQNIRTTGDAGILLIQESMALQVSHMNRVEKLHEEQFQRVTEIHDTVAANQNENCQNFMRIESTCTSIAREQENQAHDIFDLGEKVDDLTEKVKDLADGLKNGLDVTADIATQSKAVLDGIRALSISSGVTSPTCEPRSRNEKLQLEKRKRKLSSAVRSILRLSEDPSNSKVIKGDDAEDYLAAVQDLLEILQDDTDSGQVIKQELSVIATQLLGSNSLYMQRAPDAAITRRVQNAGNRSEDILSSLDGETVITENYAVQKTEELDNGTLVLSSSSQKRFAEDQSEVVSNRTTMVFKPKLARGESKPSWVLSIMNTFGTEGVFSVPLVIRVYNRRFYAPTDKSSPHRLATFGDIKALQEVLSSGNASIYDVDQFGSSLLHSAVSSLKFRESAGRQGRQAQGCLAVCEFLLLQGADANYLDDKDQTPLNCLSGVVFDLPASADLPDFKIASSAFHRLLESGISNKSSPFGPERAIATLVRGLANGSSLFFDQFLSRLSGTEFDINSYSGCNNAIMLELPTGVTLGNKTAFSKNCDIAIKYGADIRARTCDTRESCLHVLLRLIKPLPDDEFMVSEKAWLSFKAYLLRIFTGRLEKLLSLGSDIYAKDERYLEWVDKKNISFTVTRDVYAHEVQDTWWTCITKFGYSKEEVITQEARELEVPGQEYEDYLESLSKATFDERQKLFG
ncbi:hypothetical protein TWF106_000502 [Orbilia oligospora]|uniref:Uncharacterized protein n=1 Tax=Orbilia oligospora TaxID=2813651 RepID=A0A7C8UDQ7_ORBOL|nr:hypothetical protein TWF106_000502 [Orbilia oligospora]